MTTLKILFLDIDGVLNSRDFFFRMRNIILSANEKIDPLAVARLNKITDATGAKIVISSSWRIGYLSNLGGLVEFLKLHNITGEIIDMTPLPNDLNFSKPRWKEIRSWLHEHTEVTSFCILDDIDNMGPLSHAHVCTNSNVGLVDSQVAQAIKVLNKVSK